MFTQVNTSLKPQAPDKLFSKTVFFEISQKLLEMSKKLYRIMFVGLQILHRRDLFFNIFNGYGDMRIQRIAKITPSPNYGEILV